MPLNDLHRQIASMALHAAAGQGFALAGGNALIAHGLTDRVTRDVDLFSPIERGVEAAAHAVESALRAAGFEAERKDKSGDGLGEIFYGMGTGLAEWILTAPSGEQILLQMSYFERANQPVIMDIGPVLDLEDAIGGKVCALGSRAEIRDVLDVAAALDRYTVDQLIGFARRLDPGLTDEDFADAGRRLDELDDDWFAPFGLSPADVAVVRERFARWPRG